MNERFETQLRQYAELLIRVGLNVQPGQRIIIFPTFSDDPTVRRLANYAAAAAYRAGAHLVDVLWRDEQLTKIRLENAPTDSFHIIPEWRIDARRIVTEEGGGVLFILGDDPNLLEGQNQEHIATMMRAMGAATKPVFKLSDQGYGTWSIGAVPTQPWADVMLADVPAEQRIPLLWDYIFTTTRIISDNPIEAWRKHSADLMARARYLTHKGYTALKISGPGTDLTVGLVRDHVWLGGGDINNQGIHYMPNIPTEEVFTMPHKDKVNGTVKATKPLSYAGNIIDDFSITFRDGKVVDFKAGKGGEALGKLLAMDEGASRLGEMALAPNSSPISKIGRLFYETLFDENASIHIALGSAYRNTVTGGTELSDEELMAIGRNDSIIHIDFMIGSGAVDVHGVRADGTIEIIMRGGEWAFDV